MSVSVKEKATEKIKKESVKRKKPVLKKYKLKDFLGCFKGEIFYDDAVFNLGVKA